MKRTIVTIWLLIVHAATAHADLRELAHGLPDITRDHVDSAVTSALVHATPEVSASLLVALCWAESRCEIEARPRCGVLLVWPADMNEPPSRCADYAATIDAGIAIGVAELEILLADHRVHHNLRLALRYRACGNVAFAGTCSKQKLRWVENALDLAKTLDGAPILRRPSS